MTANREWPTVLEIIPDLEHDSYMIRFTDNTVYHIPQEELGDMPRLSGCEISRIDYRSDNEQLAQFEELHPEVLQLAEQLGIKPNRLLRKNRGEMICLRLESGTHPAFPFIVTSLADAPASKLGYRTREDALNAATDYVREHGRPFYVLQIVAKLEKKPAPVDVVDWSAK